MTKTLICFYKGTAGEYLKASKIGPEFMTAHIATNAAIRNIYRQVPMKPIKVFVKHLS